jgi:N-acetylneuraminic acid mutarotase
LPEPRSSFDAAVLDDAIYVIGGWSMQGDAEHQWHETAWKLDLSTSTPEWQPLPSPSFQRRAMAVAAYDGKVYVIGGMQQEGGPTRRVDVFDTKTNTWSQGPDILGDDGFTGFGASAFATGGRLYVSTIKGTLQRLSTDGKAWEIVGQTPTARFFHRLLPIDDSHLLVVGGANMSIGKFDSVESLSVTP